MPSLVELEPRPGNRLELHGRMTIGRDRCEIILDDPEISRHHARIEVASGEVTLEDLGSRNGTYVNDERIDRARHLRDGDLVRLGQTAWRLESAEVRTSGVQPAVTAPQSPVSRRGDVPAPAAPSAIPAPARPPAGNQSQPPPFEPPAPSSDRRRERHRPSAARRAEATVASFAIVAATAAAVIIYLAAR